MLNFIGVNRLLPYFLQFYIPIVTINIQNGTATTCLNIPACDNAIVVKIKTQSASVA
jgi:hypothetical protein